MKKKLSRIFGGKSRLRSAIDIEESEYFLSNIFSSIPDGISVSDTSMRVMWVNDAMKKWYSHAMPIVGRKCFEVYHGRKRYCDVCPVRKTFRTGKMAYEVVPRTGPGKKIIGWMDLYSFPLRDKKSGRLMGVIEYVRDITERKRAEDELKASEKRYKTLVENASDFIFTVDGDGVVWSVNTAAAAFLGKQPKDVVGKKINNLFPSKHVREFVGEIRKVIETNSTYANIERIIQFRGREVTLSTSLSPIKGDGEKIAAVLGIARDISEKRRIDKALKESEKKYHALFEEARDAVLVADAKTGVILDANREAERLLKLPRKKIIGTHQSALHPREDREKYRKMFLADARHGRQNPRDVEVIDSAGKKVPVAISSCLIELPGGKKVIQGVFRDVTYRKEAEEKLKLYSENLEQMVAERTRELDRVRADLFAAAKLSAMGRMGAGIAHQLNSPICGGMLLTDTFMAMEGRSPKEMELLKKLRGVFESMQNVIQCMLSIAGVRTGGQPHDFISVNGVLKNILSLASVDIKKQKIFVETDFDATIPAIDVGVGELDQAFLNIINNAVDAMKNGGRLFVKTAMNKGVIEVVVSDTGEGISKVNLNRLFEPFFTTKIDKHGLGLGLSIAKQIIDKYQGTISVKSEPNKGTEFVIHLPAGKY